jgi:protein-L-isoaspartate(D-aspartate) O-methyltransferase
MVRSVFAFALVFAMGAAAAAAMAEEFAEERERMVREVMARTQATRVMTGIARIDPNVLEAMRTVPRHAFVPGPLQRFAYQVTPLPLGYDQNLSSPFITALMLHIAEIEEGDKVFETGTDSGYQAALLAEMGAEVVSVEIVEEMANEARVNLIDAGYGQVRTRIGDGFFGWSEEAPYDVILLKEAVNTVPKPLLEQLAAGGRIVAPVGSLNGAQDLTRITKDEDGENLNRQDFLEVQFAPLQGGERI